MKLKYDDGELTLIPETEADMNEIKNAFGEPLIEKGSDFANNGYEMSKSWGVAVYQLEDKQILVEVKNAWWNYDD